VVEAVELLDEEVEVEFSRRLEVKSSRELRLEFEDLNPILLVLLSKSERDVLKGKAEADLEVGDELHR